MQLVPTAIYQNDSAFLASKSAPLGLGPAPVEP